MIIKCKMSGEDVELPCAAATCPLFGDCAVQYAVASQKKMTNADRIRAMTDEQLANIMIQLADLDSRIGYCQELPKCEALLDTEEGIPASMCEQCLLQWLQKPAEVE